MRAVFGIAVALAVACHVAEARTVASPIAQASEVPLISTETVGASPTAVPAPSPVAYPTQLPPLDVPGFPPARRRSTIPIDRSDELVGGLWNCKTFAGTRLKHRVERGNDVDSLNMSTTFTVAKKIETLHETYYFQRASSQWVASLAGGTIIATAPRWTGETWPFAGSTIENQKSIGFRMTYTFLDDDTFRRLFEHRVDPGGWAVYSGELCHRSSRDE